MTDRATAIAAALANQAAWAAFDATMDPTWAFFGASVDADAAQSELDAARARLDAELEKLDTRRMK